MRWIISLIGTRYGYEGKIIYVKMEKIKRGAVCVNEFADNSQIILT
jgi:hypothetical protein